MRLSNINKCLTEYMNETNTANSTVSNNIAKCTLKQYKAIN